MGTKKKYKAEEIILKLREADVELGQVTSGAKGKGRGRGGKLSLKVFLHLVQDVRPFFRTRNDVPHFPRPRPSPKRAVLGIEAALGRTSSVRRKNFAPQNAPRTTGHPPMPCASSPRCL